jgi:chitin disaccharide deacetylase
MGQFMVKTTSILRAIAVSIAVTLMMAPAQCQDIKLIVRGDDLGMTQGSLVAFERAFNEGVLTSGAIIVPGPWFESAAELARRNPGWCTGVHLCLVGEWRGFRWRPVLPWDKVRSMVDEDGFLYASPAELFAHQPKIEEIDAELRAQVNLAKKRGVNVQYVDMHYASPSQYPGLEQVVRKIGADYNVPVSSYLGEKRASGVYTTPVDQKLKAAVQFLDALGPGLWLWVSHIGIDSPEQRALIHTEPRAIFVEGGVGRHRAEELNVLTSLEVKSIILKKGIVLTNYRELSKEKR